MKTITTLTDYCQEINIPAPRYPHFDIRRFEDNMATVNARQEAFRHEFYAIAIRTAGSDKQVMGKKLMANLFFNSPYQVITWEIIPDWKGYYIIFDQQFISANPAWRNFIIDYPFLRLDQAIPLSISSADEADALHYFKRIHVEYHGQEADKFQLITAFTQLLLLLTRRYFLQLNPEQIGTQDNRAGDILLVSRFQSLIESALAGDESNPAVRQAGWYAEQLAIHPNYLNTVAKRITGKTALQLIQGQLLKMACSYLHQTELSVKEIAYLLHYTEPTHFNAFFKRSMELTPQQYRAQAQH